MEITREKSIWKLGYLAMLLIVSKLKRKKNQQKIKNKSVYFNHLFLFFLVVLGEGKESESVGIGETSGWQLPAGNKVVSKNKSGEFFELGIGNWLRLEWFIGYIRVQLE